MTTLQTWLQNAAAWVSDNSTDVVLIGLGAAALLLLGGRRN
jgi:hypothetical protein